MKKLHSRLRRVDVERERLGDGIFYRALKRARCYWHFITSPYPHTLAAPTHRTHQVSRTLLYARARCFLSSQKHFKTDLKLNEFPLSHSVMRYKNNICQEEFVINVIYPITPVSMGILTW